MPAPTPHQITWLKKDIRCRKVMIANQNKKTKGKIIEKLGFNPIKLQETIQMAKKEFKGKGIELPGCIPTKLQ
jgi:ribosomal protein S16